MFDIVIPDDYIIFSEGTSDGTQDKYFYNDYWYKKDRYGGEGIAEYLACLLLKNSTLPPDKYADYEYGMINGNPGCRSRHFLKPGESLITLYRLHQRTIGSNIADVVQTMDKEARIEYTLEFVLKQTGLDLREYFANTFYLDLLILNEDRHFNNLSIIFSRKEGFGEAPIFDNGKSLLVGNQSVNDRLSMEENITRVVARPFSGDHYWNCNQFSDYKIMQIDFDGLSNDLEKVKPCREKEVLLCNLKKYRCLN